MGDLRLFLILPKYIIQVNAFQTAKRPKAPAKVTEHSIEDGLPLSPTRSTELAVIESVRRADTEAVKSSQLASNSVVAPLNTNAHPSRSERTPASPISNALSLVRHATHTDRGEECAESAPLISASRSIHCQTDSIGPVETLNLPD